MTVLQLVQVLRILARAFVLRLVQCMVQRQKVFVILRWQKVMLQALPLMRMMKIIGYQFVSLGKMTDFIKNGDDPNTAWEKAKGQYGRVADAVKIIDPKERR